MSEVRFGTESMMGTGYRMGLNDGEEVLVTGSAGVTKGGRDIGTSSWTYDSTEAHDRGMGVGIQLGLAIEPVVADPSGPEPQFDISVPEIRSITPTDFLYGRRNRWGEGYQYSEVKSDTVSDGDSGYFSTSISGAATWSYNDSQMVEDVLGTSMLGDDIPTHFIPAIGMTVSKSEAEASTWANPDDGVRVDMYGNGFQYGQGYEFGEIETDDRLSVATGGSAGLTKYRGEIGAFSAVRELIKLKDDVLGISDQLGLDVESNTATALSPQSASRHVSTSDWIGETGQTVDRLYGRGRRWGEAIQFGTRKEVLLTTTVTESPSVGDFVGSALWDRSIEDISFDGLGRGYAIGLEEQIGEFSTVSHTYQAYGPTGVRTIGDARRIFRFWAINAQYPIPATEEVRTYDQLSLTMRAKKSQVVDVLRPLFDASSGEVDVIEKSGGSYESFDTSQSGNEFTITPAHRQRPTRVPRNYLVDKYDEQIVDQKGDEYQVSVDFVPEKTREPDEEYEGREESDHEFVFQKREPEQWQFVMHSGTIATKSITKDIKRGKDGVNLRMVMKPKQTQIFEESASYVEGITEREIPDGDNKWDDGSPGSRNTTYIVPPEASAGVFDEGNYRITKWTTTRINYESYEINASFVRSEDPGQTTKTSAAPGEASLVEMGQTTDAEATTGEGSLVE